MLVRLYRLLSILDTAFKDMVRQIRVGSKEDGDADKVRAAKAAITFFDFHDRNRVFLTRSLL